MDPFHFACPHCSTRLRVRDALSVGRPAKCPDCAKWFVLVEEKAELVVRPCPVPAPESLGGVPPPAAAAPGGAVPPTAAPAVGTKKSAIRPAERKGPARSGSKPAGAREPAGKIAIRESPWWLHPPIVIAVVTTCVAAVAVIAWSLSSRSSPAGAESTADLAIASPAAAAAVPSPAPIKPVAEEEAAKALELASRRLEKLGASLLEQAASDGAFPPGTTPDAAVPLERRLSWQAVLADRLDGSHPAVAWDKAWDDPLNEPFVRRRLIEFQNPAIGALTGGDGYPATHFVGIAGVGPDAARLDARHPRAGVFGYDRQTRLEDLRDGAAHTWLVAGVQDQLGSWAAGGAPTMRSLTREPYVNGPDGFGSGQAGSMLVLMADGRVQAVSAAADPRIVRAMATIADGQPRIGPDGEYDLDALASAPQPELTIGVDEPDDSPLEPEFASEPAAAPRIRRTDIAVSLRQPIVQFDLPRSKPLVELLPGLAEMIGSPIRFDAAELGAAAAGLKNPVQVRLQNTTVGEILDGMLKPAGLGYRVESDHIRLVPRE